MHTEEEARKKWCPMGRCSDGVGGSYNRSIGPGVGIYEDLRYHGRCIASDCMWWVWAEWEEPQPSKGRCGIIKFSPMRVFELPEGGTVKLP